MESNQSNRITAKDVLSARISFPTEEAGVRLSQLVGLDEHIESLERDLRLIFDPGLVEAWSNEHYRTLLPVVNIVQDAVPLIVFEGDVGTGKTALAEVIGQRVADKGGYGVHLVKMSTQVRGTGYVGEMGSLLAASFKHIEGLWKKLGEPVIFVIDEADSLLTTRTSLQHHHEDKSGVNTILQHLDAFRRGKVQVAVIAITNRPGVLDPAIRRRTTSVLTFERPNPHQIHELLDRLLGDAFMGDHQFDLNGLVRAAHRSSLRLTYSDLTLRFVVPAVRDAVSRGCKLDGQALVERLKALKPTPPMADVGGETRKGNHGPREPLHHQR